MQRIMYAFIIKRHAISPSLYDSRHARRRAKNACTWPSTIAGHALEPVTISFYFMSSGHACAGTKAAAYRRRYEMCASRRRLLSTAISHDYYIRCRYQQSLSAATPYRPSRLIFQRPSRKRKQFLPRTHFARCFRPAPRFSSIVDDD